MSRSLSSIYRVALLMSCLSVCALSATAQQHATGKSNELNSSTNAIAAAPLPFEPNEELVYEGYFTRLLLRNINVAELSFTSTRDAPAPSSVQNKQASADFHFTSDIESKGIVPRLFGFRFHQRVESIVDPASFAVLQTLKLDEQNERQRTSVAIFDQKAGKVTWTERNPKELQKAPRVVTSQLKSATQDIVSIFYFLRTRILTPGTKFDVAVSDAGRIFRLPVEIMERKKLKTVLGETQAVRVVVDAFGDERLLPGDGTVSIWFTDDARRIPVQAHVASSMGTFDVKLKSRTLATKKEAKK